MTQPPPKPQPHQTQGAVERGKGQIKEKQNTVKINSSEHYESDYRRVEKEKKKRGLKKIKGYTPTKQKTEKLQQRGKQLLLFRKENTQKVFRRATK